MILYNTWDPLWWARRNGSSLLSWNALLPALFAACTVAVIQEAELTLIWFHPYAHQVFSLCVTFLLTYRSQLAYQRFWEARTNLQAMSARWIDAATSIFLFDDQTKNDAEKGREKFRGELLHLMSMLHCFACLHLIRKEQVTEDDMPDHIKQEENKRQGHDSDEKKSPEEVLKVPSHGRCCRAAATPLTLAGVSIETERRPASE